MSDRILIMTQAPGRINREIDIDLARPVDRINDSFLRFRSEILEHLHFAGKAVALSVQEKVVREAAFSKNVERD